MGPGCARRLSCARTRCRLHLPTALMVVFRVVSLADAGNKDEADFRNKRDLLTDTFTAFVKLGLKLAWRLPGGTGQPDDVPGAVSPGLLEGL